MKRQGIELYRFIMTLMVCLHHFRLYSETTLPFGGGYLAVDFFFILSGYFLYHHKNLDSRFGVFMEIYESYLEEAISEECMQSALDFLYLIPEKMKDDFSKFGFPQNEKQEYMWEYVESAKSNGEYQYFWKPDSYCRVLLAC